MPDHELVDLAEELKKSEFAEDSIVRKIIDSDITLQFMVEVVRLNVELMYVLADRLKACSPHIVN